MTRLDRLERIAQLIVGAGLRARREMRQQNDKITIMVDKQIKNEHRFAALAESQRQTDRRFAEFFEFQKRAERRSEP